MKFQHRKGSYILIRNRTLLSTLGVQINLSRRLLTKLQVDSISVFINIMIPMFWNFYQPMHYYTPSPYDYDKSQFRPCVIIPKVQGLPQQPPKIQLLQVQEKEEVEKKTTNVRREVNKKSTKNDEEYQIKSQNSLRNTTSNIAHHILSFIKTSDISRVIVEKTIKAHNISMTVQEFFVLVHKIKLRNYVRLASLQEMWSGSKNKDFSKIIRVLSHYFLNTKCFASILSSRKIRHQIKYQHLPKIRELSGILRQIQPNNPQQQ